MVKILTNQDRQPEKSVKRKDVTYKVLEKTVFDTRLKNYYYYTEIFKAPK